MGTGNFTASIAMKCIDQMLPPMIAAPRISDLGDNCTVEPSYPKVTATPVSAPIMATKIESITRVGSYTIDIGQSL